MAVTYLIRFAVKPDRVPRFLSLLNGVLDAMRAEATFREAILHEDPKTHPASCSTRPGKTTRTC